MDYTPKVSLKILSEPHKRRTTWLSQCYADADRLHKIDLAKRYQHVRKTIGSPEELTDRSLDKLAQLRNSRTKTELECQPKSLQSRAKSKYITHALVEHLHELKSPLKKSYERTFHCSTIIQQEGHELTAKYCNNRWCLTCNRIRTGKLINAYQKPLKELKNKQMVTLTVPNCLGRNLSDTLSDMIKNFQRCKDALRKQGIQLNGIRKTECTYNHKRNDYHPHFHFIIEGEKAADKLVMQWLKIYPKASAQAQDVRPANEKSAKELFKYFTKIFTYEKGSKARKVHVKSLDIIFCAMRSRRVFQAMGRVKQVSEDIDELQVQVYKELPYQTANWNWEQEAGDWINRDTGECLSGYSAKETDYGLIERLDTS